FSVHLSLYADETSARCTWLIPEAHYLESWGDGRAYDGTVAIQQPLIAPLYGGRSAHEVLDVLVNEAGRSGYEIVQAHWLGERGEDSFEQFWQTALHDGVVAESALPPKEVTLRAGIGGEPPA